MNQIMTRVNPSARVRAAAVCTVLAAAMLVSACGTSRTFRRGQEAAKAGDLDGAVALYRKALQDQPDNPEIKIELERTSQEASRVHLARARAFEQEERLEEAIFEYRQTVELDPSNRPAVMKAAELERLVRDRAEASRPRPKIDELRDQARRDAQPPLLRPTQRIPLLRFNNASTQDILNFVASATGINIIYERDFKPTTFSIQLDDVTLEEALNQIMSANQLWYKVVNDRTILVINDTTPKRQQYEEQVIRTFYISHADPQELLQMLNTITRVQGIPITPTIAVNKTANTITVRATRGVAGIIERIIEANDKPRAEITIDVEILEVNRSRAKQYGLNLSQYTVGTIFSPETAPGTSTGTGTGTGSTTTSSSSFNLNTISQGISTADFYLSVPQAIVRFLASDSRTRLLARPQLRGTEGAKLTLNLGDEIPVPSTVFQPFATGGPGTSPLTSFNYRPVGVNLEMTPRVSYEGDIIVEIVIESSTLGGNIDIGGTSLPTFGSRKVNTKLRLREGESHLLAGLLREEDRRTLRGLPGIMNLPILRQLLSDNDTSISQTDVVMLLTPRIVRTHELTAQDVAPIYIGSQSNIGLTGAPQLIAVPAEEEPPPPSAPEAPVPAAPPAPGGTLARPGVPTPPAAAAPGVPSAPVAAPAGAPQTSPVLPPGVRLPDGTASQPVSVPGASPLPGTTTAPPSVPAAQPPPPAAPPAPAPPAPGETLPAPAAPATPLPAEAPAPVPPPAGAAQIVVSTPGNEFRVGGGPYTVPISITNASRVSTVSLSLSFNPAVLRVRTIQEGSFLRQGGVAVAFTQQVDAAAGRIDVTMTRTGDQTGAAGAGLLAAVLFEPVAPGTAGLSLSGVATTPQGGAVPLSFSPVTLTVR